MHAALIPQPARPWFREPWPWLIMLGPFVVIVAGVITTVIAFRTADGLVADDYYKQGLAINRVLARESRAAALKVAGTVWYAPEMARVRVLVAADAGLPATLVLRLAHPTRAGMDQTVPLHRVQPGIYDGQVNLPPSSRWLVTLESDDWRLVAEWDGRGALSLGAPRAPSQAR